MIKKGIFLSVTLKKYYHITNFEKLLKINLSIICYISIEQLKSYMARPIQETPILCGEDARRFIELMDTPRPETPERKAQIKAAYETVMRMLARNQKNEF